MATPDPQSAGADPQSATRDPQSKNPQSAIRNLPAGRQVRNPQSRELPPARTEPLAGAASELLRVPYRVRFLAGQLFEAGELYLIARTRTKIDVGNWLLRGRVWAFALADSLALVACGAAGVRVFAARVPYRDLRESLYNHVTGELALAPVKHLPFRGLKVDPITGYQALAQIYHEG